MTMPLRAPERVLPTLNTDGTRRWVEPRLFKGRYYRARLVVAWLLIALFAALPFVRIGGKPAILLDVRHWQFTLFGRTFLPTDGVLLMLLLLAIFVGIILATALVGRVWCGWACPQTVYMEFVFRPLERLLGGKRRKRSGTRPALSPLALVAFALSSVVVANVFLAYFVGTADLGAWMRRSPTEHPGPFLVVAVTSGLVFFDFAYFREQMCTVACPYARLQSVLLDPKSLIVAYDGGRGEPRGKKGTTSGDCVDCRLCVAACPTGIDIRNGLQLECITCTQCMDACDGVMQKLGRPLGLIRYTSQDALEKRRLDVRALLRPRIVIYPVILVALLAALVFTGATRRDAEVTLLRGIGAPFYEQGDLVRNHLRIKVRNRAASDGRYALSLAAPGDAMLVAPENPLTVRGGQQSEESIFVLLPRRSFRAGTATAHLRVSDEHGFSRDLSYQLLGPTTP